MSDQDLAAVLSELRDLRAEVSTLRAQVAAAPTGALGAPAIDIDDVEVAVDPVSRRQALRTAGVLAAGALTGGAALLASASPAAALPTSGGQYTFSSDSSYPAVQASSSTAQVAIRASSSATRAVYVTSSGSANHGVEASASGGDYAYGMWGRADADSTNVGVRGSSLNGKGVFGDSIGGTGVQGQSSTNNGVSGYSTDGVGTWGQSTNGSGIFGFSANSVGVSGVSNTNVGGTFDGVVGVTGVGTMQGGLGGTGLRAIGDRASVQIDPQGAPPPTRADLYFAGDLHVDSAGGLWFCVIGGAGSAAKWRQLAGRTTAGSFHALAPGRAYDSRKSTYPIYGVLSSGANRTISLANSYNSSTGALVTTNFVPAGATAVFANITVVTTVGRAFLTVNPGGTTTTAASTINWSADDQVLANGVALTLNSNREVTVVAGGSGGSTNFIIDVTGYWL